MSCQSSTTSCVSACVSAPTRTLSTIALRTRALVLWCIGLLEDGKTGPTMAEQCLMADQYMAAIWQASYIITGKRKLLTYSQTKLNKAGKLGSEFVNRGITMSPADEAAPWIGKDYDACKGRTIGCTGPCVGSNTGQGRLPSSGIARVGRTIVLELFPNHFHRLVDHEIRREQRRLERKGLKLAMRVNVASDHWELAGEIADRHDGVTFYDYTAITSAVRSTDNVRRVYSRKDGRTDLTIKMLNAGHGAAVVFDAIARKNEPLPTTWHGFTVIDGDVDDLWFTRAPVNGPFVVGLRVKGDKKQVAQAITDGFAVAA